MGTKNPRSTVLTVEEEAACVAFRKHTLLPLDDCLYALQSSIPHLTRSSLHHLGIGVAKTRERKARQKKYKQYPIGHFHVDIANVRTEEGKHDLFFAIGCTSQCVYAALHEKSDRTAASDFLSHLVKMVPYKIHTVLTYHGAQFCVQPRHRNGATARFSRHMFQMRCHEHSIEHPLPTPNHPWTNGQVAPMHRRLKEPTGKRYDDETHEQRKAHLCDFLNAYNDAKRLKILKG